MATCKCRKTQKKYTNSDKKLAFLKHISTVMLPHVHIATHILVMVLATYLCQAGKVDYVVKCFQIMNRDT